VGGELRLSETDEHLPMELAPLLKKHGGVMHRSSLRAMGISAHRLKAAIDEGTLVRAGRDRVAVADVETQLLRAAELGARLTCISAARVLKLWTQTDDVPHLAVPRGFKHTSQANAVLHWGRMPVPADKDAAIEPLHNVLAQIARCQPLDYAVATFDSALNTHKTTPENLRQLAGLLKGRFAEVVALTDGRADAGGESLMRVRLGARGILMTPQVVIDGHRVDGLIGEHLVIQVDGFAHHKDPVQRARDLAQDRRLVVRGDTVLRFPSKVVEDDWPKVERDIAEAMALGLHLRPTRT
jgi:very-short-patch-repair endonuclease